MMLLRRPPGLGPAPHRPDLSFDSAELLRRSRSRTLYAPGQSAQARESVATAVREQPDRTGGALWGNVQTSLAQAERESDNVRRLLQADGMASWRPEASALPAQRPANASMDQLLEHVPVGGTAWLSFGNSGVTEMLMNWVHHVSAARFPHLTTHLLTQERNSVPKVISLPTLRSRDQVLARGYGKQMVVAAFDEPLLLKLHTMRIPAYNYTGALPSAHFRHAPHLFHRMGFLKAECIRLVLETGRHGASPPPWSHHVTTT